MHEFGEAFARVFWAEYRSQIAEHEPELARVLDAVAERISPEAPGRAHLFRATYAYGEPIVSSGNLVLPLGTKADEAVKSELGSTGIPVGIVLSGAAEIFTEEKIQNHLSHSVPLSILTPGGLFGVFEYLDSTLVRGSGNPAAISPWSISSGARSIRLIFPVASHTFEEALRRKSGQANSGPYISWTENKEHNWNLVRHMCLSSNWNTSILLLPSSWLAPEHTEFHSYLLAQGWLQSSYLRQTAQLEPFLRSLASSTKLPAHLFPHLRQLIAIASGTGLGFQVVGKNVKAYGPFNECLSLLKDEEFLRATNGSPTPLVLQPGRLRPDGPAVFYSASFLSVPDINNGNKKIRSYLHEFLEPVHTMLQTWEFRGIPANLSIDKVSIRLYGHVDDTAASSDPNLPVLRSALQHISPVQRHLTRVLSSRRRLVEIIQADESLPHEQHPYADDTFFSAGVRIKAYS